LMTIVADTDLPTGVIHTSNPIPVDVPRMPVNIPRINDT